MAARVEIHYRRIPAADNVRGEVRGGRWCPYCERMKPVAAFEPDSYPSGYCRVCADITRHLASAAAREAGRPPPSARPRRCSRCKEVKPPEGFGQGRRGQVYWWCKKCMQAKNRAYYHTPLGRMVRALGALRTQLSRATNPARADDLRARIALREAELAALRAEIAAEKDSEPG